MAEKPTPNEAVTTEAAPLTTADVAKLVDRKAEDILSFRDYGTYVVAVTVDGQKAQADKNGKK